jgi:predicted nucleic acid-binding protein
VIVLDTSALMALLLGEPDVSHNTEGAEKFGLTVHRLPQYGARDRNGLGLTPLAGASGF